MSNPWRGEVTLVIDGQACVMRLTLGALAGLEDALAEPSLIALVERFEQSRFSSGDVLALLKAGLRGGNCPVAPDALDHAEIEGGPMAAARAAAELIARAFVVPGA
ncbi:gene transfer agent family protein [uncultured Tateyamaria sp.]|uniref:gene transfer agent family protein n=2 Tax=uncultured Tateyamaria sp. TaxID=455651 RepID=UPI002616A9FC|nr:gene transfer agent family protein [uncultured Tateyamaria sp.]